MLPWREETLPDTSWRGWYYAIPSMDPRKNVDRGLGGYFTKYVGCSHPVYASGNEPAARPGVTHPRGPGDYQVQYRSTNPDGIEYYTDPRPSGYKYPFMWQWRQPPATSFRPPPSRFPWLSARPQVTPDKPPSPTCKSTTAASRSIPPTSSPRVEAVENPPACTPVLESAHTPNVDPPTSSPWVEAVENPPASMPVLESAHTPDVDPPTSSPWVEAVANPLARTPVLEPAHTPYVDPPEKLRKVYYKSPWDEFDPQIALLHEHTPSTTQGRRLRESNRFPEEFPVPTLCTTTRTLEPTTADRERPIDISSEDTLAASLESSIVTTTRTTSISSTHTRIRKPELKGGEHAGGFIEHTTTVNTRSFRSASTCAALHISASGQAGPGLSNPPVVLSREAKISTTPRRTGANREGGTIHERRGDSPGEIQPVTNAGPRKLAPAVRHSQTTIRHISQRRNAKSGCATVDGGGVSAAQTRHQSREIASPDSLPPPPPCLAPAQEVCNSPRSVTTGDPGRTTGSLVKINLAGPRLCQIDNEDLLCPAALTRAPPPPSYAPAPPRISVVSASLPATPPLAPATQRGTEIGTGRGTDERKEAQKRNMSFNLNGIITPPSTPTTRPHQRINQAGSVSRKKRISRINSATGSSVHVAGLQPLQAITPPTIGKRGNEGWGTTVAAPLAPPGGDQLRVKATASLELASRPRPPPQWPLGDPYTLGPQESSPNSTSSDRNLFYAPLPLQPEGMQSQAKSTSHATSLMPVDQAESPRGHVTAHSRLHDMQSRASVLPIANSQDPSKTPTSQVEMGSPKPRARGHVWSRSSNQYPESPTLKAGHQVVTMSEQLGQTNSIQQTLSPLNASQYSVVIPVAISSPGNTGEEDILPEASVKEAEELQTGAAVSVIDEAVIEDATVAEDDYAIEVQNVPERSVIPNILPTSATSGHTVALSSNTVKEGKLGGQKPTGFGPLEVTAGDWVDLGKHAKLCQSSQEQPAEPPTPRSTLVQSGCIAENSKPEGVTDTVPRPDPVPVRQITNSYALIKKNVNGIRPPPPSTAEEFQVQLETFVKSHDLTQFFSLLPGSDIDDGRMLSASVVQPAESVPTVVNPGKKARLDSTGEIKTKEVSIQDLAQKAFEKSQGQDTETAHYYADLSRISLYTTILLVDDSTSMRMWDEHESGSLRTGELETSKHEKKEKVKRKEKTMSQDDCGLLKPVKQALEQILRIATTFDKEGISLHFLNADVADLLHSDNSRVVPIKTEEDMKRILDACPWKGGTELGTMLSKKVLEPLLQQKVEVKPPALDRPVLVSIITDGEPEIYHELKRKGKPTGRWVGESRSKCQEVIADCKDRLIRAGYSEKAIVFHITRIGGNKDADEYLNALATDPYIGNMIYCSSERLDKQIELVDRDHTPTAYQSWWVKELLVALG